MEEEIEQLQKTAEEFKQRLDVIEQNLDVLKQFEIEAHQLDNKDNSGTMNILSNILSSMITKA
jgi:predicted ribosome quality control (RQC) complex YloA/Tae2 family protein